MSLQSLLDISEARVNMQEVSEERMLAQLDNLRNLISFFREYPDLLVDYMAGSDGGSNHFKFYFYQRVFIRIVMRHRYVYATFPRAYENAPMKIIIIFWTNSFNCRNSKSKNDLKEGFLEQGNLQVRLFLNKE